MLLFLASRRFQRIINHADKLFRPIVLYLGIDVHRCFAVLMTCQILDRLWINSRIDQVGNIGVTKLMRSDRKVKTLYDVFPVYTFLPRLRLKLLPDRLPVILLLRQ